MPAPGPFQQIPAMDPLAYQIKIGDTVPFVEKINLLSLHISERIPQMNGLFSAVNQAYQYKLDAESAAQLAAGDVFDDEVVSNQKSWSSQKIATELTKAGGSMAKQYALKRFLL